MIITTDPNSNRRQITYWKGKPGYPGVTAHTDQIENSCVSHLLVIWESGLGQTAVKEANQFWKCSGGTGIISLSSSNLMFSSSKDAEEATDDSLTNGLRFTANFCYCQLISSRMGDQNSEIVQTITDIALSNIGASLLAMNCFLIIGINTHR